MNYSVFLIRLARTKRLIFVGLMACFVDIVQNFVVLLDIDILKFIIIIIIISSSSHHQIHVPDVHGLSNVHSWQMRHIVKVKPNMQHLPTRWRVVGICGVLDHFLNTEFLQFLKIHFDTNELSLRNNH